MTALPSATTRYAIGLDVGGTNARAAAVDPSGRLLTAHRAPLVDRSPEAVATLLAGCVRQVRENLGEMGIATLPTGVGLGLAAQLESGDGRVLVAPNLGWRDVPFGALLAAQLGSPVALANDLAAAALGESKAGAARGHADALLVYVGSGVGSGLVLGGRIHHGARGVAGEFGHMKVEPGGLPCGCGERGCLEAYAGGVNLARRAGRGSTAEVEQAAEAGDPACLALRDEAAERVGLAAANAVTLLNPSVLILGGGVLAGSPAMRHRVESVVRQQAARCAAEGLVVTTPALGDDAGLVGAAFLQL